MSVLPQQIISKYNLTKHPEGGFYFRTYQSEQAENGKYFSTAIYYLLEYGEFSKFHSIKSDEMWHFYYGSPLKIHMISPQGEYKTQIIGNKNILETPPQFIVPANYIFAAEVIEEESFAFVGCTVTPGFDFNDFKLYSEQELKQIVNNTENFPFTILNHFI